MGRAKAIAKKAANKALTRAVSRTAPTPPPKAEKKEKKAMDERVEDLEQAVQELTEENDALKAKVAELESKVETAAPRKRWARGKLPGEKLIKTDQETGDFVEIDRDEWDALA